MLSQSKDPTIGATDSTFAEVTNEDNGGELSKPAPFIVDARERPKSPSWIVRQIFVLASLFSANARADSADQVFTMSWVAPQGCPTEAAVTSEVKRILGGTTSRRTTAHADVVQRGPQRWSVHLVTSVDGAPGERSLEANSCEALASATALIVALTVDPSRALATPPPLPKPQAPQPAAPLTTQSRNPVSVLVATSVVGESGTLPSASLGGQISLGFLLGPVRAEISGADWFAQDATALSGQGTRIHLVDGALRGCFRGRLTDRFEIDPCAGAALVLASSDGFGEDTKFERSSSWGSLNADLLAVWRIAGPLALRATLGLGIPLARPSFVLLDPQGQTFLHRASFIAGRGSFGLEVRFP